MAPPRQRAGAWALALAVAACAADGLPAGSVDLAVAVIDQAVPAPDLEPPPQCRNHGECQALGAAMRCCAGLCVDTAASLANCGGCGLGCRAPAPNQNVHCGAGYCTYLCDPGFEDCDPLPETVCETKLTEDPSHCGRCGNPCTPTANVSIAQCFNGQCTLRCRAGFADCDGDPRTGCEIALASDPEHCGACGNKCGGLNVASAGCNAGTCTFVCRQDFGDCDGNPGNGCETDVGGNIDHCGRCARICRYANARSDCTKGVCSIQCNPNHVDCNGQQLDGCEADLTSDPQHCGACYKPCAQGQVCAAGVCR